MRILQLFIYSLLLIPNKGFISMDYLPDGLSRETWNIKQKDNNTFRNKNLSDKKFKARSFEATLEKGNKEIGCKYSKKNDNLRKKSIIYYNKCRLMEKKTLKIL